MTLKRVLLLLAFLAAVVAAVTGYHAGGLDDPTMWLGVALALVIGEKLA